MRLSTSLTRLAGLLAVLPGLALLAPPARSADDAARTPVARRAIVPAMGGMVIGIDPETGMLVMPSPEQLERLVRTRQARLSATRPSPIRRADGTTILDARSWMRDYSYVRVGADGRTVVGCAEGHDALLEARQAPAPRAAQEER